MSRRYTTAELEDMAAAAPRRYTTAELEAMQPSPPQEDTRGAIERGLRGMLKPFAETGIGIRRGVRGLFGGDSAMSPEEQRTLDYLTKGAGVAGAEVGEDLGTAGTVGEFAGNVGMFAAPGGAIMRGASLTPKAVLAADVALNAGLSGTQSYGRGDSFAEGAAWGAGGSAVGAGLAKGAATLGRGFNKVSDPEKLAEVNRMLEADIPLTPGQYANGVVRWAEDRLAAVPVIGDVVKRRQMEAFEPWNREVLADIVGRTVSKPDSAVGRNFVTDGGQQGFTQAKKFFGDAYDAFDNLDFGGTKGSAIRQRLRDLKDVELLAKRNGQPELVASTRAEIANVRSQIPEFYRQGLADLDKGYSEFQTAARTAKYAGPRRNEGVFTPGELLQAVSARSRGTAMATGEAPLQEYATRAARVLPESRPGLGEQIANPLLGAGAIFATGGGAAVPLGAIAAPYLSRTALKHLRGQTEVAQSVKALERELRRLGLRGTNLGGAAGATEYEE